MTFVHALFAAAAGVEAFAILILMYGATGNDAQDERHAILSAIFTIAFCWLIAVVVAAAVTFGRMG